jgi:hypothetical protein
MSSAYLAPIILKLFVNAQNGYVEIGTDGTTRNIPVTESLPYSVKVWAGTSNSFDVAFYQYRTGTGTWSQVATASHASGALNTTALNGTVASDATHIKIRFTMTSAGTPKTIYVAGIQVTQTASGNTPVAFNPGTTLCIYDDITNYVMDVHGDEGKSQWDSLLPDEGQLTVILNNASRLFSPEYTGGALYGKHKTNIRVVVRLKRDISSEAEGNYIDDWVTIWSGWINKYDVEPNQYGGRSATITAKQGLFNLEKVLVPRKLFKDAVYTDLLYHMLYNGYENFGSPFVAKLGWSKLGGASYLFNPAQTFDLFGSNATTIPVVGHNWRESTEATKLLSWITQWALGHSFITATGQIGFVDRSWFGSVVFGDQNFSDYQTFDYEYGIEIRNRIRSGVQSYSWYQQGSNKNLVFYKDNITIGALEVKTINIKFTHANAFTSISTANNFQSKFPIQPENIIAYTSRSNIDGGFSVNQINHKKVSDGTFVGANTVNLLNGAIPDNYLWETTHSPQGFVTGVDLTYQNTNNFDVSFDVAIYSAIGTVLGIGIYSPTKGTIISNDDTSGVDNGIKEVQIDEDDNPFVDQSTAASVQTKLLGRYATNVGWFSNLGIIVEDTETFDFEYPGSGIKLLSEYQTGVTNKELLIIGRQFAYQPQVLKFEYTLAPAR